MTVLLVCMVGFGWAPFSYRRIMLLYRIAHHWEGRAGEMAGERLPDFLAGERDREIAGRRDGIRDRPWYRQPLYLSSALLTILLGSLLIVVLFDRALNR